MSTDTDLALFPTSKFLRYAGANGTSFCLSLSFQRSHAVLSWNLKYAVTFELSCYYANVCSQVAAKQAAASCKFKRSCIRALHCVSSIARRSMQSVFGKGVSLLRVESKAFCSALPISSGTRMRDKNHWSKIQSSKGGLPSFCITPVSRNAIMAPRQAAHSNRVGSHTSAAIDQPKERNVKPLQIPTVDF